MKKLIEFDLDNTLAESKSKISPEMADLLRQLLDKYTVLIISGGRFERFEIQVIDLLDTTPDELEKLHIMPTCGTRYHTYSKAKNTWELQYHNDLTDEQIKRATASIEKHARTLGLWEDHPYGEIIENRGSQITYSALGQDIIDMLGEEGIEKKYSWDPDMKKRNELAELIRPDLPDLEVRVGGITSLDITLPGVDKAYGTRKIMEALNLEKSDILFVGDMLQEGGNDYPVKAMGIDSIEVESYRDTPRVIGDILDGKY